MIDGEEISQAADTPRPSTRKELHEVKGLVKHFAQLGVMGFDLQDYIRVEVKSVTGLPEPPRFELLLDTKKSGKSELNASADDESGEGGGVATENAVRVVNLRDLVPSIHDTGKRGMDIKRFKGLGEMDAEQLWETTMNPENRVLLRVTWDAASHAEQLFSILMGEAVEPRRKYIEDHALEVKNLDV